MKSKGSGWGGSRVGAGRKPKSAAERALDGGASHGRVLQHPNAPAPPATPPAAPPVLDEADAPNDLEGPARKVWLRLAPLAMAKGTLTKDEGLAFEILCRNVVLEDEYAKSRVDAGGPNHRGIIKIVDTELSRFGLHGMGKPVVTAGESAIDPMEAKYGGGRNRA